MTGIAPPSFGQLQRGEEDFSSEQNTNIQPPQAREQIVGYLQSLDIKVSSLSDLQIAINNLEDEEELSAYPCQEGLAVHHASDGWWVLFTEGFLLG